MPLTPAIRPVSAISMTADRPIIAPPTREALGVKAVIVIALCPCFRSLPQACCLTRSDAPGHDQQHVNTTPQIESPHQRYFPIFPVNIALIRGGNSGATRLRGSPANGETGTWSRLRIQQRFVAHR